MTTYTYETAHGRNARERTLLQKWLWCVTPKHPRPWVLELDVGNGGEVEWDLHRTECGHSHSNCPAAVNCGAEAQRANHM